jgi:hypothetical protein
MKIDITQMELSLIIDLLDSKIEEMKNYDAEEEEDTIINAELINKKLIRAFEANIIDN